MCSAIAGAIFPLTLEEFVEVNDSPETGIQLAHDPHGRYVGTLASTHQIHCVVSLTSDIITSNFTQLLTLAIGCAP